MKSRIVGTAAALVLALSILGTTQSAYAFLGFGSTGSGAATGALIGGIAGGGGGAAIGAAAGAIVGSANSD
jgi:hypothetical protein